MKWFITYKISVADTTTAVVMIIQGENVKPMLFKESMVSRQAALYFTFV